MSNTDGPEHVFQVSAYDEPTRYIAADYMGVDSAGVIRLFVRTEALSSVLVAVICPQPTLVVARVDALISHESTPRG